MTTDDFTTAARAEAQRAYQDTGMPRYDLAVHMAAWARDHLAAQAPPEEEVEAMARMTVEETSGCGWETFSEESRVFHRKTARRRLSAARAVGRDAR